MFNLYTYEKIKKKQEEKRKKALRSKEKQKLHKEQLNSLANKYEERVKNFITEVFII